VALGRQSSQKPKRSKQDFSTGGWDLELGFRGAVELTCFPCSIHHRESSSQYQRVSMPQMHERQECSNVQNCLKKDERGEKKRKDSQLLAGCLTVVLRKKRKLSRNSWTVVIVS